MEFSLDRTAALLSRTPIALNSLLRDLPDAWASRNEGENTWSVFDAVAHLIHTDQEVWLVRAKLLLTSGEAEAFGAFDRAGYKTKGKPLSQLLDEFARVRAHKLAELQELRLEPQDFDKRGRHPSFGPVTLRQLLSAWGVHDLTHVHQISRIMAHQYREAVGPWHKFLGVLRCTAHGD